MNRWFNYLSISVLLMMSSCARNSNQTWEDLKTAGRYMHRGIDAMFGKEYESRLLTSDEEFMGPYDEDFIPLKDADLKHQALGGDIPLPQSKIVPGQKGAPALSEFYAPSDGLKRIFQSLHFETDEYTLRNKSDIEALLKIATYMKNNPSISVVVEGHCDERASASYNMALGMKRANYVRSFLVKQGVDLNRIYTVSRGKEQPIALGHSAEDWQLNRRSEFKIYQK